MAFNFDKIKVAETLVVRYRLPIPAMGTNGLPVVLLVKPADANLNPSYAGRLARARARWAPIPSDLGEEATRTLNLQRLGELYPGCVVVGWEEVYDADGKTSPFTPENFRDFITALGTSAPDVASRFIGFVSDGQNFRDISPEQIAKLRERLVWELRYQRLKIQVDAAIVKGRALPEWYLAKPEPQPGDEVYLTAFQYLSSDRMHTESYVAPIPRRDILDHARFLGLDPDDAMVFLYVLNEMDHEYLADQRAQAKGRANAEDAKDRALGKGR